MATRESDMLEIRGQQEQTVINDEEGLAPLRALETALAKRISVKTSLIKLHENEQASDSGTQKFLHVDDELLVTDERTLEILEESVSDIISVAAGDTTGGGESRGSRGSSAGELLAGLGEKRRVITGSYDDAVSCSASSVITTVSAGVVKTENAASFYSIPSCSSNFEGIVSPESLQNAQQVIDDLEANGPAGLVHLSSLSAAIGKPIRVWSSGGKNARMVGRSRLGGQPVDIEYHEPGPHDDQGHWTLRDNKEPRDDTQGQLNDCLFSVVADQVDGLAPELRQRTIGRMRAHVRSLANRIDAIAKEEKCDRISLLVGGARYNGERPQDAKKVIDESQRGRCHPDGRSGHPRGHASHPDATGPTESAENYSKGGNMKSAFLSREDQDAVGHLVLESPRAQAAMTQLNAGANSIAVRLATSDLEPGPLPEAAEYLNGKQHGPPKPFKQLVIVLRHHIGQQNNPDADVFVHTFYPVIR